ncbi:uncharacterized protein LOC105793221 [Gossypium raimondii]|uniref:uncharacterized protein LOC105793221 n=1 Tax=Gossypium raimondii TaxID=29730 RepID=UPI00063AF3D4|nr:uncharacterized protein LOC105793221 [Gossypium raimondii]
MYHDLCELYWWPGLKHEVTDFVGKCLTCQQVKAEHQLPSGLLQPIKIPLGILTDYSLQKLAKLYVAEIVRLHGVPVSIISNRDPCFTSWLQKKLHEALGLILYFSTAFHPQTGGQSERVIQKKILRFGQKGKLSPKFIGPYRILKHVGPVTYQLDLPPKLDQIHDVFHVSMLRRYWSDPTHIVPIEEIEIRPDLTFEEKQMQILDCEVKVLRKKSIPLVKVLWRNHSSEEATWEPEEVDKLSSFIVCGSTVYHFSLSVRTPRGLREYQIFANNILVNLCHWYRWAKPLLTSKILGAHGS